MMRLVMVLVIIAWCPCPSSSLVYDCTQRPSAPVDLVFSEDCRSWNISLSISSKASSQGKPEERTIYVRFATFQEYEHCFPNGYDLVLRRLVNNNTERCANSRKLTECVLVQVATLNNTYAFQNVTPGYYCIMANPHGDAKQGRYRPLKSSIVELKEVPANDIDVQPVKIKPPGGISPDVLTAIIVIAAAIAIGIVVAGLVYFTRKIRSVDFSDGIVSRPTNGSLTIPPPRIIELLILFFPECDAFVELVNKFAEFLEACFNVDVKTNAHYMEEARSDMESTVEQVIRDFSLQQNCKIVIIESEGIQRMFKAKEEPSHRTIDVNEDASGDFFMRGVDHVNKDPRSITDCGHSLITVRFSFTPQEVESSHNITRCMRYVIPDHLCHMYKLFRHHDEGNVEKEQVLSEWQRYQEYNTLMGAIQAYPTAGIR